MNSHNPPLVSATSAPVFDHTEKRRPNPRFERVFFSGIAAVILVSVFIGFARSYYMAGVFKAPLPSLLIHIHGAAFSLWILLFISQTSLIALGRVNWHRRLGMVGFALACAMMILGLLASTQVLARPTPLGESPRGPRAFYAVPLSDLLVFAVLVCAGFRFRKNAASHKRLLLVATIAILDAAFVRWPVSREWWTLRVATMCCYPLLLSLAIYDWWSVGKIHRATLLASILLVSVQQVRTPIGRAKPWQKFAASVQQFARERNW